MRERLRACLWPLLPEEESALLARELPESPLAFRTLPRRWVGPDLEPPPALEALFILPARGLFAN
ncbi:MAG: hypothetical protein IIA60_07400 [Candidatus Marinimicrobia bacterium]|nr:hypothetical protein [Candidatus Neomarinimicrobiota bacterium]